MDIMDIAIAKALAGGGGGGGGESSIFIINTTDGVCDKTWKEIETAYNNGKLPVIFYDMGDGENVNKNVDIVSNIYSENSKFGIATVSYATYTTDNENGYPFTN